MEEVMGIEKYADVIKRKAQFVEKKGFSFFRISEFIIDYANKDKSILIVIYWGRYTDFADVGIRFEKTSKGHAEDFDLSWFSILNRFEAGENVQSIFAENSANTEEGKLTRIILLLDFLYNNFDDLTNIEFCRKKILVIRENIKNGVFIKNS